jgi:hypothetical protein
MREPRVQLPLDVTVQLKGLFGTHSNAYRCLALDRRGITQADFRRALSWTSMARIKRDIILEQWEVWQDFFLNGRHVLVHDFVLKGEHATGIHDREANSASGLSGTD